MPFELGTPVFFVQVHENPLKYLDTVDKLLCKSSPFRVNKWIQWTNVHIMIIWGQWSQMTYRWPLTYFLLGRMCVPTPIMILLSKCHENPLKYAGTVSSFARVKIFNTYIHTYIIPGGTTHLPEFKFLAKFPIGFHIILQMQIKKFKTAWYLMCKIMLTKNQQRQPKWLGSSYLLCIIYTQCSFYIPFFPKRGGGNNKKAFIIANNYTWRLLDSNPLH